MISRWQCALLGALLLVVVCLAGCGGGDPEPEPEPMPCKYRPDCSVGPPLGQASAAFRG